MVMQTPMMLTPRTSDLPELTSIEAATERGTQRRLKQRTECEATRLESGVGEITASRFRHCRRYSRRLQLKDNVTIKRVITLTFTKTQT